MAIVCEDVTFWNQEQLTDYIMKKVHSCQPICLQKKNDDESAVIAWFDPWFYTEPDPNDVIEKKNDFNILFPPDFEVDENEKDQISPQMGCVTIPVYSSFGSSLVSYFNYHSKYRCGKKAGNYSVQEYLNSLLCAMGKL